MKKNKILLAAAVFFTSLFAKAALTFDSPDLGAQYSRLEDYYNKADQSLDQCSIKPLPQFSEDYGGCYFVVKNVDGIYYGDSFVFGIVKYLLTIPGSPAIPGNGPLFPPTPAEPSQTLTRRGPGIIFGQSYAGPDDELSLDGLGMTDFPSWQHSDSENALAITKKTNLSGVGPATETDYLRRYSSDGTVALKQAFQAQGKTVITYGYCWRPITPKP